VSELRDCSHAESPSAQPAGDIGDPVSAANVIAQMWLTKVAHAPTGAIDSCPVT